MAQAAVTATRPLVKGNERANTVTTVTKSELLRRASPARDETNSSNGTTSSTTSLEVKKSTKRNRKGSLSEGDAEGDSTTSDTSTSVHPSVLIMHGLEVSPGRGEFVNFDLDTTYVIRFRICNVSSEMRTLRFRGPNVNKGAAQTKGGFRVTDLRSVQLAPGLSHTVEVEFVTESMKDYTSSFTVLTSQQDRLEVPLVAWCLPRLHVPRKVDFGLVEHRRTGLVRTLKMRNGGRRAALLHCRVVDSPLASGVAVLTMHPTSSVNAPAMAECAMTLELAPVLPPGKHAIRLAVDMECLTESTRALSTAAAAAMTLPTHYVNVLVEVVECRSTLLDATTQQETRAVHFATIYAGATAVQDVIVVNGSEQPVNYAFQTGEGGNNGRSSASLENDANEPTMGVSETTARMGRATMSNTPGLMASRYTNEDGVTRAESPSDTRLTTNNNIASATSRGAFRVVPEQGRLAPKERRLVKILFSPPLNPSRQGWWSTGVAKTTNKAGHQRSAHNAVTSENDEDEIVAMDEEALRTYEATLALRFVETEQTHHLHLSGSAAETSVWLSETVLDFGTCPMHIPNNNKAGKEDKKEVERTLSFELHNRTHHSTLMMDFTIAHVAHFHITPRTGRVRAGCSVTVNVTFRPHRLGHFSVTLPICVNNTVQRHVTLQGRAVAPSALHANNIKTNDEANKINAATLVKDETSASPRRTLVQRTITTQSTTTTTATAVVDLGMTPAAGLRPPQPTLDQFRKEVLALDGTTLAGNGSVCAGATAQGLGTAGEVVLHAAQSTTGKYSTAITSNGVSHVVPMNFDLRALIKRRYAAVPANAKERRDCRRELCAAELLQLMLPIKHIEFGRVTIGAAVVRPFYVYNGTAASVLIEMPSEDLVTRFTPHAQIVPAMRMAEFDVELRSVALQSCQQVVSCNVNGRHQIRFTVQAEVVPVEVTLSQHDLLLRFCDFTEEPVTRGGVTLFNNGSSAATYRWRLAPTPGPTIQQQSKTSTALVTGHMTSTPFTISPAEGVLPAAARTVTEITFTPPPGELHYECDAILEVEGAIGPQVVRLRAEVDPTSCVWSKQAMALYGGNTTTAASTTTGNNKAANTTSSSSVMRINNGTAARHAELTVDLHRIPIGQPTRFTVGVHNRGARNAYFTFSKLPDWLSVTPSQGRICARETEELVMELCSTSLAGPVQATLLCQVRGMRRPLRLHLSAVFVAPPLSVTAPKRVNGAVLLDYGDVYVGASALRAVCLQNFGDVEAIVSVDLQSCPDFELLMPGVDEDAATQLLQLLHHNESSSEEEEEDDDVNEGEEENDVKKENEQEKPVEAELVSTTRAQISHVNSVRSITNSTANVTVVNAAAGREGGTGESGVDQGSKDGERERAQRKVANGPITVASATSKSTTTASNTITAKRSSDTALRTVSSATTQHRRQQALVRPVAGQARQYTVSIPALCEVEVGIRYKPSAPRDVNKNNSEEERKTSSAVLQARWSQIGSDEMHLLPVLQLKAHAMPAQLSLSCTSMDFPLAVVGSVVRPRELVIRNVGTNSNKSIGWRLRPVYSATEAASHFLIEPSSGTLSQNGSEVVSVTFLAQQAGSVRCDFDLILEEQEEEINIEANNNASKKKTRKSGGRSCGQLVLRASATRPRLSCPNPAVVFPAVPLGVAVRRVIYIMNEGFDLIHLRYDNADPRSPIVVDFPSGHTLSTTQKRLPVGLTFCCLRPITLSSSIVLRTDKEESVTVAVAGSALNSILLTEHFVRCKEDGFAIRPTPAACPPLTNASISATTTTTNTTAAPNTTTTNTLAASFTGGMSRSMTSLHNGTTSGSSKAARMAAAAAAQEQLSSCLLYTCQLCDCRGETGPAIVYDPANMNAAVRKPMSRLPHAAAATASTLSSEEKDTQEEETMNSPVSSSLSPRRSRNITTSMPKRNMKDVVDVDASAPSLTQTMSLTRDVQDDCYAMIDTVMAGAHIRSVAALQPLLESLTRWMNRTVLRNPVDKLLETLQAMHGGLLYDVIERLLGKRPRAAGAALSRRGSSIALFAQRSRSGSNNSTTTNTNTANNISPRNNTTTSNNTTGGAVGREKEARSSTNTEAKTVSPVAVAGNEASARKGGESTRASRVSSSSSPTGITSSGGSRVTHRGVMSLDTLLTFMRSYGACLSEVQLPYLLPYDEYVAYVKHELASPFASVTNEVNEEARSESVGTNGGKRVSGQSTATVVVSARERTASQMNNVNITVSGGTSATTMVTRLVMRATKEPLTAAQFHYRAAHAWTTVLLETVRVFYLCQFTLEAMIQRWPKFTEVLATTNHTSNRPNTRLAVGEANTTGKVSSNIEMNVLRQGLAGSNVYSAEESALLLWLQRVTEAYGAQEGNIFGNALNINTPAGVTTNTAANNGAPMLHPQSFAELSDCRPYIAAVLYAIPELPVARLFFAGQSKLVAQPMTGTEQESNAQLLLNTLATLGLAQLPSAKELRNASQAEHVLFTATLFDFLAQFKLAGTIQFTGKLLATITETVELENKSDFTRSYAVLLDDHASNNNSHSDAYGYYKRYNATSGTHSSGFTSSHTEISVPAHSTATVQLSFCPRFPRTSYGRCFFIDHSPVLLEERQPLVFALRVDPTSDPLEVITLETPLYETLQTDIPVRNPFARDCVVNLRVTQEFVTTNSSGSTKNTPSVVNEEAGTGEEKTNLPSNSSVQRAPEVQGCGRHFAHAFVVSTDVLPLRADETARLPLTCVPLMRGQYLLKLTFYEDREGEFAYWVRLLCTTPKPAEPSVEFRAELGETVRVRALVRPSNNLFERAVRLFEERHRQAQASHHRALLTRPTQQAQSQQTQTQQQAAFSAAEFLSTQVHHKQSSLNYTVTVLNEMMQGPHPFLEPEAATLVLSDSNAITASAGASGSKGGNNNSAAAVPVHFNFKPNAVGLYRGFIVLSSPMDLRVLRFSGECVAKGQRQTLHFNCPARQCITQEITITNNSAEKDWLITASLEGGTECFSGPKEIRVPKGKQKDYSLRYAPAWMSETTDKGTLVLCNEATGQRHTYMLIGKAEAPLSEETLTLACRARERRSVTLNVPNVLINNSHTSGGTSNAVAAHECTYTVETDLPFIHGKPAATLTVPRASMGRYTLELLPTVGGHYSGKVVFHTHGGRFVWFVIQLDVTPPEKEDTVVIDTDVRTSVMVRVQVSNPLNRPLTFAVKRHGAGLFGEDSISLAASATAHYDCLFLPTNVGESSGRLSFSDNAVGEFWYALEIHVRDAPAETLQFDPAPLGTAAIREVKLTNITQCECALLVQNSNPVNFRIQPTMVLLPPHGEATVQIIYTATAVHTPQCATLVFSHALLGQWRYECTGQGTTPLPAPLRRCVCERRATTLLTIPFTNTLDREARLRCSIKGDNNTNKDTPHYFSLRHMPEQPVAAGATINLTLAYAPQEVGCHRALLEVRPELTGAATMMTVTRTGPKAANNTLTNTSSSSNINATTTTTVVQAGAYDVCWQFPLEGMAEWRDDGSPFSFRCAARKQCEKVILLRAVGRHAINNSTGSANAEHATTSEEEEMMKLCFEPDAQQHYEAAVKASFDCSLLLATTSNTSPQEPMTTSTAGGSSMSTMNTIGASGDGETFAVRVRFAPLRPLVASGDLVLYQPASRGGGCWRYRVYLEALPAPPDDLIALESAYRTRTTISFDLFNVFPYKSRFAAYFTTDSSKDFTVQPAHGVLLPFVQGQRTAPAATPLYVSFTPSTRVPQVEGLLVVDTEDMQWSFRVTGRLNSQMRPMER